MQGSELEIIEVVDDVIVVEVSDVVIEVAVSEDVIEIVVGEGALTTEWGSITGTLGNQRDLKAALDGKADADDLGALALKDAADWNDDIVNKPSSFPPAAHDHDDRYYTEAETDGLLAGKSDADHTHDDRYYTEAEVDTALNLKAPKASPTFTGTPKAPTAGATVNNTQIATTAFVQRGLAGKSDSNHTHDDRYYTEAETDALLAGKSDTGHTHDDRYYTEAESDAALAGKQDVLTFDSVPAAGSSNPVTSDGIRSALDEKAAVIVCGVSGDPAVFSDGAPAPVVELTVGIEPVQSGTGDPAPENIRPISGWTGATITRTGKNLLETVSQSNTIAEITATVNTDGSITINGVANANAVVFWNLSKSSSSSGNINDDTKYFSNGTYHKTPYDGRWAIQIRGSNSNPMTGNNASLIASYNSDSFVIDDTYAYNCAQLWVKKGSSFDNETIYPWICKSDEVAEYPITFPTEAGTVYGGALDVTAGVLTVTHGKLEVQDLPALTGTVWRKSSQPGILNAYYIGSANMNSITPRDSSFLCSHFEQKDTYVGIVNGLNHTNTGVLYVMCDEALCGDTVAGFTQWLADQKTAGTPVELWYELVTPVTYQLDATAISTLLGQNTISADTGPVALRYRADTKLYIDGKFAELQALILEN